MNIIPYLKSRGKLNLLWILVWMAVIFSASSTRGSDIPQAVSPYSYLFHFSVYVILGLLAYPFFSGWRRPVLGALLFCVLYGVSDELHQLFVPGRSFGVDDMLIDAAGGLVGALIARRLDVE